MCSSNARTVPGLCVECRTVPTRKLAKVWNHQGISRIYHKYVASKSTSGGKNPDLRIDSHLYIARITIGQVKTLQLSTTYSQGMEGSLDSFEMSQDCQQAYYCCQ